MKTKKESILSFRRKGDSIVVTFENDRRISIRNSNEIERQLLELIERGETSILLDFSKVEFIDSSGFHALLSVHIDAKLNKLEFYIFNVNKEVLELFSLVRLDNVFDIRKEADSNYNMLKKAS